MEEEKPQNPSCSMCLKQSEMYCANCECFFCIEHNNKLVAHQKGKHLICKTLTVYPEVL